MGYAVTTLRLWAVALYRCFHGTDAEYEQARLRLERHRAQGWSRR